MDMTAKLHKKAPLPFVGQKRNFIQHYIPVINTLIPGDGDGWTIIDAFGGSGLLSHVAKRIKPNATVVYNDFDDYHKRLQAIPATNALRRELAGLLHTTPRDKKLSEKTKGRVFEVLNHYDDVDMKAVSGWLLFSGKYANTVKALEKHTLYNCLRRSDYEPANDYLNGLKVVKADFEVLLTPHLNNDKCLFVLDPPYVYTQQGMYANDSYFGMVEFLRLMGVVRPPFVFFSSTRSELLEYLNFVIENKMEGWERFEDYRRIVVDAKVNAMTSYEGNLIYKQSCK